MTRESTADEGRTTATDEKRTTATADGPTSDDRPTTADGQPVDSLTDPGALRDRDGVEFLRRAETVAPEDFEAARDDLADVAGWVVVGVGNGAGAVLLIDDGDHGWTLPAAPVDRNEDWIAAGRELVAGLTGVTVDVGAPERVRRLDYETEEAEEQEGGDGPGDDDRVVVHHLVLRAAPVTGDPLADEPVVGCDAAVEVGWFDALPDGVDGAVADDARLFL